MNKFSTILILTLVRLKKEMVAAEISKEGLPRLKTTTNQEDKTAEDTRKLLKLT
jgi:hypothetical protein